MKKHIAECRASYPDVHFTIDKVIMDGDWTATLWTYEGTQSGVSPTTGAPPTNKHVKFTGCTMARWENGKAVEGWEHGNYLGLLQQLGLIPKPE
jgi:predicted ester cyclase